MCNQLKIRETQQIFADYVMLTRLYHTASDGKLGGGGGGGGAASKAKIFSPASF